MAPDSSSVPSLSDPAPGHRRALLVLAGCSLLAVGVGIHVARNFAVPPPVQTWADEPLQHESRFVAYLNQPDETPEIEAPPEEEIADAEAGGSGQRHKGEEGVMGKPTSKNKSGLYAMKGPRMVGYHAGSQRGFLPSSPHGVAGLAVRNDDEDVWGGIDEPQAAKWDPAQYARWVDDSFAKTLQDAVSTFSIDVDTGSYTLIRKGLVEHSNLPFAGSVRVEEMINYFDYDYPEPSGSDPVSITTEVGPCPWDEAHRLIHVGLQAKHVAPAAVGPRNLVFLVDVSGSMAEELPLVVSSLAYLTEQLGERDRIAIVVYAGAAGTVLPPTVGSDKARILGALERLEAGGGTNGGEGIHAAYALAQQHFVDGGINRVVLATDGDFNVGVSDHDALVELIEKKRESGVFLSVLGFGGANYQDHAMEQLADKGNGNYAYIDGLAEARKVLVEQAGSTLVTVAKDVKIQVDFDPKLVQRYRLVGYTNRVLADADFADDTKDAGEMGAGHTVTALYEIEPVANANADEPLMALKLRYKDPDGDESKLLSALVVDEGAALDDTSNDFRFAAAVAGFGQVLQGLPTKTEVRSLRALQDLALGARGDDPTCRRAELVGLIGKASLLRGVAIPPVALECAPTTGSGPSVAIAAAPFDWKGFALEVLCLLPPIMALPLFVMALWRPRRRQA